MICSLNFTSLYGGVAIGSAFTALAWATWVVKYQPVVLRPASTAKAIAGHSTMARSAEIYANLLRQARLRVEAGCDASDILESAIGLVRARRLFLISVTLILWTAAMLATIQFIGGNSRCLRLLAEGEPARLDRLAEQPAHAGRHNARTAEHRQVIGTGVFPAGSDPEQRAVVHVPVAPRNRLELVHGPA